jgi:hypothetical protein
MTFFSHVDPSFESVFSMEAINEPLMDASRTPGLGQCGSSFFCLKPSFTLPNSNQTVQKNFVQTVRAVEDILGIGATTLAAEVLTGNITAIMQRAGQVGQYSDEVKAVLIDSIPVLLQMVLKYGSPDMLFGFLCLGKEPLTAKYGYFDLPRRLMVIN